MKSKRKVIEHLGEVAYTKNAIHRIMGFLLGLGIVEKGEMIEFKIPEMDELRHDFNDFHDWFENEEEELAIFGSLIEDLADAQQDALAEGDMETFKRVTGQLMLLLEDYGNDILEADDNDKTDE